MNYSFDGRAPSLAPADTERIIYGVWDDGNAFLLTKLTSEM